MKCLASLLAALVLGASVACASTPAPEVGESAGAQLDEPIALALFETVHGRIDANASVTYAFRGERGWKVDVLAATPDQHVAWNAPHLVVLDEATGTTLFDEDDALQVQGRSGHTIELPSTGRYIVTLSPTYVGQAQEAFALQVEAQIPCGTNAAAATCPSSLTCQSGQCWPAELGPQRCDASGVGPGCVPAGHSECDSAPRQTCQLNTFICARTGGTETPSSCLGSATTGVCCRK
jgi:hypothetical protein